MVRGLLGEHSPDVLRDTIVFMCALYFAPLHRGTELRSLEPQQINLKTDSNGEKYLLYQGMGQKIIQEGLMLED